METSRLAGDYSKNIFKFAGQWEKMVGDPAVKRSWKVKKIDILMSNQSVDGFFSENADSGLALFSRYC